MVGIQVFLNPFNNDVFYIERTYTGVTPYGLKTTNYFKKESKFLKKLDLRFEKFLIDFVPEDEIDFWELYYRNLFKCWGFEFIRKNYTLSQALISGRYFRKLYSSNISGKYPTDLMSVYQIDLFDSKLKKNIEDLNLYNKDRTDLIEFRLFYLLTVVNLFDHSQCCRLTWQDLLEVENLKVSDIDIPIIKRCRTLTKQLYRQKHLPNLEKRIFRQKYQSQFPILFNGMMFFHGHTLRIDGSNETVKQLSALYWIFKKGFSVQLHSFLSAILGVDVLDSIDIQIFPNHLGIDYENIWLRDAGDKEFIDLLS